MKKITLLAGGYDDVDEFDSILEYDITGDAFTQIGIMAQARDTHAVSVVQYEEYSKWCDE